MHSSPPRVCLAACLALVSCRASSGPAASDGGPLSSGAASASSAPRAYAWVGPSVCSLLPAADFARAFGHPITQAEVGRDGGQCTYKAEGYSIEFMVWAIILHGTHVGGTRMTPQSFLDTMRRGTEPGHQVFGPVHELPGLGDEAIWLTYAGVFGANTKKAVAPEQLEVLIRRGDSLVSVIRPLLGKNSKVPPEEVVAGVVKALPPVIAAL